MARYFALHPNYAKFTGVLGNVYPVKEGVAILPDSKEEVSAVLTGSYGGEEYDSEEKARKALAARVAKAAGENASDDGAEETTG